MAQAATAIAQDGERQMQNLVIKAPNLQIVEFEVRGTAPYVQQRFWKKADIMKGQQEGSTKQSKSRKARPPREFEKEYEQAKHVSKDGWYGIPAPGFRNALISACRVAGFVMTRAKLSVFIVPDGFDREDGTPLVRIIQGDPHQDIGYVRNRDGSVDLRARAMFDEWKALVRVRYDGDQFNAVDVANLMERAGMQVGIGEGRPDSPDSAGVGWGTFTTGRDNNNGQRQSRTRSNSIKTR